MSLQKAIVPAVVLATLASTAPALAGSPEEVAASLRSLSERFPDRVAVRVLTRTGAGRDVLAARLTVPGAPEGQRPVVLLVAGLEGTRGHTTETVLGILESLARRSDEPDLRDTLGKVTLECVPLASPDAAARRFGTPRYASPLNARPDDSDRDYRIDEDGPEDLDGDGEILLLRVPDPEGDLREVPGDPRILVPWKAEDGLVPRYRCIQEGIDNDGDGRINEDGPGGVDVSRNFPHGFESQRAGCGRYPSSEPEARALLDLVAANPNLSVAITYGAHDNLLAQPESREDPPARGYERRIWKGDAEVYGQLGDLYREVTGREASEGSETRDAPGSLHETLYHHLGLLSLAVSRFGREAPPAPSASNAEGNDTEEDAETRRERAWLDWNDRVLGGKGFVEWRPLHHPDLGAVAVGGWRPYARLDPPREEVAAWLPAETQFVIKLLERLPRVRVHPIEVRDRGDGVFEVRASITNYGELPTALVQGAYTGRKSPINIELSGGGLKFLGGTARRTLDRLTGRSRASEVQWLLLGSKGQRVRIEVRLRGQTLDSKDLELETGGRL